MQHLTQDLRYAVRVLRKSPGFTVAAILILAVGIGVNIAAFGFFNLIVLRTLPVRDPGTLLRFQRVAPDRYASVLPYPEMAFFREHSKTLSAVMAWNSARLTIEAEGTPLKAHFVTANLFSELGAVPTVGALLDPARDEGPGATPVVVLSHVFWQRRFDGDPLIAGRSIHLNGKPVTVVGVARIEFSGLSLDSPDVWLPMIQQPYFVDGSKLPSASSDSSRIGLAAHQGNRDSHGPGRKLLARPDERPAADLAAGGRRIAGWRRSGGRLVDDPAPGVVRGQQSRSGGVGCRHRRLCPQRRDRRAMAGQACAEGRPVAGPPQRVGPVTVSAPPYLGARGHTAAQARAYLDTLTSRLRNVPGVESVSLVSTVPFGNKTTTIGAVIDGRPIAVHVNNIDPEFFQTMTIPVLRGRNLMPGDVNAIVISQSFAVAAWSGQEPLGKTFPAGDIRYTVVGVAANARVTGLQDVDAVECYFLAQPSDRPSMGVLVKTSGPPENVTPTVASIAKAVDPRVLPEIQLMKSAFQQKMQGPQYSALSVSLLAFVALLLACVGIVGLVAYSVSQRTREIGIRMALGASSSHVLTSVLRQFSLPVGGGLLAGVGAAAALSMILRRALFGVSNLDPAAYVAAIGVFALSAGIAALWPARRALKVDPLRALRSE